MTDQLDIYEQRIVYGARCTWWDTIQRAATTKTGGLPCCPHCAGVLFEVESEVRWWEEAYIHEKQGHPGYVDFLTWMRGRCYPTFQIAQQKYDEWRLTQSENKTRNEDDEGLQP